MAPRGHEKHVTGSASFEKHGEAINGGPVGDGSNANRPGPGAKPNQGGTNGQVNKNPQPARQSGDRGIVGNGGGILAALLAWLFLGKKIGGSADSGTGGSSRLGKIIRIAIIAIIVIAILRACNSAANSYTVETYSSPSTSTSNDVTITTNNGSSGSTVNVVPDTSTSTTTTSSGSSYSYGDLGSLFGYGYNSGSSTNGWTFGDNRKNLNTSVANGARSRFYTPKSGDKVNVLIYMIGTDLESQSGMATSDLQEMCQATISSDVNVIVYGGGCKRWQNNAFSNTTNKVYLLKQGGSLTLLGEDGDKTMTDPSTLAGFISYVNQNFDGANSRNILILWDHGGGSLTGYGYDERHSNSSSMDLSGINTALSKGGMKYDFIGFDACLMATTETALVASNYADYLVASEESEPGIGWYYTNWLTMLSNNTSISTLEIGKQICDDFVTQCARQCSGQSTTLSLTDLAEFSATVPNQLKNFSTATTTLVEGNGYKNVANARAGAKEFAEGNGIDQVDLVHFALNLGTDESKQLANALLSSIKYNNTSSDMANSYGLSIYFPYSNTRYVSAAVATYSGINLGDEYSKCIQTFASYAGAGQSVSYGYSMEDILNGFGSYSNPYGSSGSSYGYNDIYSILESMMGSSFYGRSIQIDPDKAAQFISSNHIEDSQLVFTDGKLVLSDEQRELVTDVLLSVYYDTGDGRADLGTDFTIDMVNPDGSITGVYDGTWLAINNHVVAYYFMHSFNDGSDDWQDMGYVPCLYNGERAKLIVVFDEAHPDGFVSGVMFDYVNGETSTVGKIVTEKLNGTYVFDLGNGETASQSETVSAIKDGDTISFLADYYDYNNYYTGTYRIGDELKVSGELEVSYVYVVNSGTAEAYYRITDIYGADHWSERLHNAA